MMISDQAKAIVAHLDPSVQQYQGGQTFVASDMVHFWNICQNASYRLRVVLVYAGETVRGDFPVAAVLGRVDRMWRVGVTRGRGFNSDRGTGLTDTMQNAPPLYDMVECMRDVIRSMLDVSLEFPVDYRQTTPLEIPGYIVDAYLIEFSVATDLPLLSSIPANSAPPI